MTSAVYQLPGGFYDENGVLHRDVELVPLNGRDEETLRDNESLGEAVAVTRLLARCLRRLGERTPVTEAAVRSLLIPDRQYLVLKLYAATFGQRAFFVVTCPFDQCGRKFDVDFTIDEIPVDEPAVRTPWHSLSLPSDDNAETVATSGRGDYQYRLPNGGDLESLARLAGRDPQAARVELVRRCLRASPEGGDARLEPTRLTPELVDAVERHMEAVSPHVDLDLATDCPECRRSIQLPLDPFALIRDQAQIGRDRLYREVHALAIHYHWSEAEILDMPLAKRQRYLRLLGDMTEQTGHASA
jgi:hypothetical protein